MGMDIATAPQNVDRTSLRAMQEIQRALALLAEPGQVVELRALGVKSPISSKGLTYSGYFNDWVKLASAALQLTRRAEGVYITLNPIDPRLLARRVNRVDVAEQGKQTSASDVLRRRWLVIDCDPNRPKGISSSDAEHAAGLARAREVREALRAEGWPDPIFADSANGGHLLYRIDLPTDDGGLVRQALQALAFRFDDGTVTIDQSLDDPGQLIKLYGTIGAKGDPAARELNRPHRWAKLLDIPQAVTVVPRERLEQLAATLPAPPKDQRPGRRRANADFDLAKWIADHALEVDGPFVWGQGGQKWVFRVCPWNPEHANRSAYIVQFANGAVAAGCHHNSCQGHDWHALRDLVEPGWQDAKRQAERPPKDDEGSSKSTPAELGAALLQERRFVFAHEILYVYRDGVYRPEGEALARSRVQETLGSAARSTDGNEVVYWLSVACRVNPEQLDADNLVNVANGLLDWQTGALHPHTAERLGIVQLPTAWDPGAYHERADSFLDQVLPDRATRALFEEAIGYCLLRDCRYEKAVMLVGDGANGKSTALRWVSATLGRQNIASVKLQDLATNRFRAAELVGKLANIYPDLPREALEETDTFKAVVSGDEITAERKFRNPFAFRNRAKLFFSANELPRTRDQTYAFFRRWLIIPFPNRFDGERRDPGLGSLLETPEARSYLLRLAVEGLRRLVERGEFEDTPATRAALEEYQRENDLVKAFVDEACDIGDYTEPKELVWAAFERWCGREGRRPVARVWFWRRLRQHVPGLDEFREQGTRHVVGLRIEDGSLRSTAKAETSESGDADDEAPY